MTSSVSLSYETLQQKALELGFEQIQVIPYQTLDEEANRLQQWLSLGFQADMAWMTTHAHIRPDPKKLLPTVQSIIMVTLNYYHHQSSDPNQPKIARYALGDDYHDVVKTKLKSLLAWLQTHDSGIEGRAITDSAPILEKALAIRAGLGWQGKHSNVIAPGLGSWFFIGELLVNTVFENTPEAQSVNDMCGRCRRCIEACPTQAIVDNQVVDANKCIAYWTIESKAETFPKAISDHLQGWLFGCDICQEVCPWNQKYQHPTTEPAFIPRPWNKTPRIKEMLSLSPEAFKVRYRKSPIKRVKYHGLKRNAQHLKPSQDTSDAR